MSENAALKWTRRHHVWWALGIVAFLAVYWNGLLELFDQWDRAEYSYAYLIPPLCAWLVWQRRNEIGKNEPRGSWAGLAIIAGSMFISLLGQLTTTYTLVFYALLMTVLGLAVSEIGWQGVRIVAGPLGLLLFMVPLPPALHDALSQQMQLISAGFGVAILRTLGVDVYLEGNLIDLGAYQMEVAEACDGLRYLFPLLSFAYLVALIYRGSLWSRLTIFISAVPLTILINSGRLAVMGLMVRYLTVAAAEGFLHFFQSWLTFIAGILLLFAEVLLISRLTGNGQSLKTLLRFELLRPANDSTNDRAWAPSPRGAPRPSGALRAMPFSSLSAIVLLAVMAVGVNILPTRAGLAAPPSRLASFPLWIDGWYGTALPAGPGFKSLAREAGIDDFVLADYRRAGDSRSVGLCIAFQGSQSNRVAARPPRTCMPSSNWKVRGLKKIELDGVAGSSRIALNRAVIEDGNALKVVYYWYEQRGRQLANEYVVNWMMVWDALTRNRTDGALVQLITAADPDSLAAADKRMVRFMRSAYADISAHVPD